MRFLRNNGLSLFFLALFLVVLVGQAIAGHAVYNDEEIAHAKLLDEQPETLSLWRYVTSSSFGQAVMENWQSEYLQFVVFVMASVWLVQKGSTESKKVDQAGAESDEEQKIGPHAQDGLAEVGEGAGPAAVAALQLAAAGHGLDLARVLVRPVGDRLERLQRRADRAQGATVNWLGYVGERRLLGGDAAELAVGVPRRRQHGDLQRLPAPARLVAVQAGRRAAPRDGRGGLSVTCDSGRRSPARSGR